MLYRKSLIYVLDFKKRINLKFDRCRHRFEQDDEGIVNNVYILG